MKFKSLRDLPEWGRNKCGIYKITSPTGKIYIGRSVNIRKRAFAYLKYSNSIRQRKLFNSFDKYGIESHNIEIIHECDVNELDYCEIKLIADFNSVVEGLNCSTGGVNYKTSEETRNLLRLKQKAYWSNPENKRIRIPWCKGKKMSEEFKKSISQSRKNSKKCKLGNNPKAKLVLDLSTGIYYDTLKEACEALCMNYRTVKYHVQGKSKVKKTSLTYVM